MTATPVEKIQLNDVGTKIVLEVYNGGSIINDLAAAVVRTITLRRPSGTSISSDGVLYTDGTDAKMYYLTVEGDINELGTWEAQGYIEYADGSHFYTSPVSTFYVYANLPMQGA